MTLSSFFGKMTIGIVTKKIVVQREKTKTTL